MFPHFFDTLGAKNAVNTNVFVAADAQNHGIYGVFCLVVAKITVFTMFFGPGLAKTVVFTQFSTCCKKNFFHAKGTKTLKITWFSRLANTQNKNRKKLAKSV